MSVMDRVFQEKYYFLSENGREPSVLEISETLLKNLETEIKQSLIFPSQGKVNAILGLKVVITNTNTIKVK